jgi:hypothetical protein
LIDLGGPGPFRPAFTAITESKIVLESLVAEIHLIADQKHHHRPAEDALQVALNEFHGASGGLVNGIVAD